MTLKRLIAVNTYPLRSGCVDLLRMKFGNLTPKQRKYRDLILKSGFFDADYYQIQSPRSLVARIMPVRHFIMIGEKEGLHPGPDFDPDAYLRANPDVADLNIHPFRHYLQHGGEEKRPLRMPFIDPGDTCLSGIPILRKPESKSTSKVAVAIHLFYYDLWEEMLESLKNLSVPYDLFITISLKDDYDEFAAKVRADRPDARVIGLPNHGRDIFPFMHLLNAGLFDGYQAVCKLHTKKSPHRSDGETWRNHLIRSILPPGGMADELVRRILADPEAGFVVADGQVFNEEKWWGSNRSRTRDLLLRIGIDIRDQALRFPAGSIYWVTAPVLRTLRGLCLKQWHFETERCQLDGTMAHVIERALGFLASSGCLRIDQASEILGDSWQAPPAPCATHRPKLYAFYLPQFHPIPENDVWWGKGFTEWHNVTRATPRFQEHQQPKLPTDLGFYDLRLPETLDQQGRLATSHGIDAFCVYYYWFDGRRLLERPLDVVLENPEIRFPFFFCWANEKWTRAWDGLSPDVLVDQTYPDGFEETLADDLVRYFRDPRYETVDGRPKFIIYRPNTIPNLAESVRKLRAAFASRGFPEVHLGAGLFHADENDASDINSLFDHFVEIPPHGLVKAENYLFGGPDAPDKDAKDPPPIRPHAGFRGLVYDYNAAARNSLKPDAYPAEISHKIHRGLMLGWDNTPRRGLEGHVAFGCNPASFHQWARARLHEAAGLKLPEIYVNAWNEWAEGTMLEPDEQYHDAYLRTLRDLTTTPAVTETTTEP